MYVFCSIQHDTSHPLIPAFRSKTSTVTVIRKLPDKQTEDTCTTSLVYIRKTCPCNVYPLESHLYIAKVGFAEVYLFFLFLLQNIDCEAVLTCTNNLCFEQK